MDYKAQILNRLLDKYEGSGHYKGDLKQNKRVALKFDGKDFPAYDIENTETKETIHYTVKMLKEKEIIDVKWVRFEEGNIIDRVFLNIEKIDEAYDSIGRVPKSNIVSDALIKLRELSAKMSGSWINSFLESQIEEIQDKKDFTKYIPKDDEILQMLLDSLWGIYDKGDDEMLERIFSRKYLSGSKKFERYIKARLSTIVRDFALGCSDADENLILENVGIVKNAEELLFKGQLKIMLGKNMIDFTPFIFGTSMNTSMIKNFEIIGINCDRVLTIENKANYLEYIKTSRSNELVIYLGGFYSPVKREFLQKIYNYTLLYNMDIDFYHWGDIDLGGFNIFMQLKKIIKSLIPMNMDVETLLKYIVYADSFDDSYRGKLQKLLQRRDYEIFHDVIQKMLQLNVKLEQEALL